MAFPTFTIPERANGGKVSAAWWNTIRTYLLSLVAYLEGVFGSGASSETQFTVANNTADQVITGAVYDKTVHATAWIFYTLTRGTTRQTGFLCAIYEASTNAWAIDDRVMGSIGADIGCSFNITSAGQVRITSDGTDGAGKLRWRTLFTFNLET